MNNTHTLLTAEQVREIVKMSNGNITNDEYYFYASISDNFRKGMSSGRFNYEKDFNGQAIDFDDVPKELRVLSMLAKFFPKDENCKNYYPFGYFKKEVNDNSEMKTRQDIYKFLVEKFTRVRTANNGKRISFLDIAIATANKRQSVWYGYNKYSKEQIITGCSLWLWHTTRGMLAEDPTIEWLNQDINKNFDGLKVIPATGAHERYDIDAIIVDKETGVDIVYVSIKSGTTLSENCIESKWRAPEAQNGKGKNKPMMYAGIDKHDDFKIIVPEDWKGLLKERMENKTEAPAL